MIVGTAQRIAPTARNESWHPTSNRMGRVQPERDQKRDRHHVRIARAAVDQSGNAGDERHRQRPHDRRARPTTIA